MCQTQGTFVLCQKEKSELVNTMDEHTCILMSEA